LFNINVYHYASQLFRSDPIQSLYSIVCRLGFFMYLFIHYGTHILFSVYVMHVPLSVCNHHYIILFILQMR
jgi:hypothetical protein